MIPSELSPRTITLPRCNNRSIVVITGSELRHQRFALRIQQEFGDLVRAWYEIRPNASGDARPRVYGGFSRYFNKGKQLLLGRHDPKQIKARLKRQGIARTIVTGTQHLREVTRSVINMRRARVDLKKCEEVLFRNEVECLSKQSHLSPKTVVNPNSKLFVQQMKDNPPYLLLTLGGSLYKRPLLESVQGLAINQHAGWSPEYKGSNTIYWALYHRRLNRVGSTVHITTSGADAGPILRRSQACLVPGDDPSTCFARVVALGTELMIEAVHEILKNGAITAYDQPPAIGRTYLGAEMTGSIHERIASDFRSGWLKRELNRERTF